MDPYGIDLTKAPEYTTEEFFEQVKQDAQRLKT